MAQDSDSRKPTISARVPRDTYDRLEDYCEENDISKADALRRFTEDGLNRAQIEDDFTDRMDHLGVDPGTAGTLLILVLLVVTVLQNAGVL